jgi:hypothetical protein
VWRRRKRSEELEFGLKIEALVERDEQKWWAVEAMDGLMRLEEKER